MHERVGEGKKGKGEGTVMNIGWKVLKKIAENLKGWPLIGICILGLT